MKELKNIINNVPSWFKKVFSVFALTLFGIYFIAKTLGIIALIDTAQITIVEVIRDDRTREHLLDRIIGADNKNNIELSNIIMDLSDLTKKQKKLNDQMYYNRNIIKNNLRRIEILESKLK